ncbi:uncharacterized protein LOC131654881 [Vicia villosa]|uniref:uncharacterized protein LOC131654881 n=1 Tax=Vicia villosa TaxID=3911 RepID=UPI00273CAF06|nr:uncharacterized protein LOC131654881 [Vicia villosa]
MEQSIATTNKQMKIKTPKKNKRGGGNSNFISNTYAGLLNLPQQQQQQPPLLPLPHVSTILHHKPLLPRSLNTQTLSPSPKKSKSKKKEQSKKRSGTVPEILMVNPWGPDPKDLPKNLPVVIGVGNMDVFSESVFNLAPPPSSLPLPKFFMRSKLGCNTEAAVAGGFVDDGATNNLRRLLRLR